DIHRAKTKFMRSPPDPHKARPGCPTRLARVILKMLRTDPAKRYPRVNDAREELAGIDFDDDVTLDEVARGRMRVAVESYKRCRDAPPFLRDFSPPLFRASPAFIRMSPADLEKQYYLLRETLELILQFPLERPAEPTTLTRVAESHAGRNIQTA